jgi:transposase
MNDAKYIVEQRIEQKLKPYEAEITLLDEIPGVDVALAGAIIAELGADMRVFEKCFAARLLGGSLSWH